MITDYYSLFLSLTLNSSLDQTPSSRYTLFFLVVLISLIGAAATPCNSFPKIFGGNGDTYLWHIDAYHDYLAMAGDTWAKTLAALSSTSRIPYIALASISTGGKYYWAKALS